MWGGVIYCCICLCVIVCVVICFQTTHSYANDANDVNETTPPNVLLGGFRWGGVITYVICGDVFRWGFVGWWGGYICRCLCCVTLLVICNLRVIYVVVVCFDVVLSLILPVVICRYMSLILCICRIIYVDVCVMFRCLGGVCRCVFNMSFFVSLCRCLSLLVVLLYVCNRNKQPPQQPPHNDTKNH